MALTAALLATGVALLAVYVRQASPPPQPAGPLGVIAAPAPALVPARAQAPTAHRSVTRASRPVRIRIPGIGVDARLVELGLNADGTLAVPHSFQVAGWYRGSPTPGARGSSIIIGHVDPTAGPGVFYRLGALRPGAHIDVELADSATARFSVDAVREYLKSGFPTAVVYGATRTATLRLNTCGGALDDATGHYVSDVVIYASLLAVSPPADGAS